jgi:outer membrane protein TolC
MLSLYTFRRGIRRSVIAAVLLGSSAAPAAQPVTFDQTLELAQTRAPSLAAKDLERRALAEEASVARTLPDPMVSLGFQNKRIDSLEFDDDEMTMKTVAVGQEFVRGSKRRARAAAILARAGVSEAERELLATEVRAEAALAWLDLHYAQRTQRELDELLRESRLDLTGAKASYAGGRGDLSEVIAAQAQIEAVENRATENRRTIEAARARLARWIGQTDVTAAGEPPNFDRPPLDPRHIERIIEAHPAVAVYDARRRQAEAEVRSATAERGLDPPVEVMYGQREDRPDMVGLSVSVPLQVNRKNRQDRTILARQLGVQQVAAEREDAAREQRADIEVDLATWRAGLERLARFERSIKPLARSQVEAALAAYRGGRGSLAILIEARRARFDVALEAIGIETEAAREWTELYTLTGQGRTPQPLTSTGTVSR